MPRIDDHSGSTPPSSRNDGRKIATSAIAAPATPFGDGSWIAPRYAEKVKSGPGHRLDEPVAREELLLAHPAGRDDRVVQERQHDVTSPEHERARAVHRMDELERLAPRRVGKRAETEQQHGERREAARRRRASATGRAS